MHETSIEFFSVLIEQITASTSFCWLAFTLKFGFFGICAIMFMFVNNFNNSNTLLILYAVSFDYSKTIKDVCHLMFLKQYVTYNYNTIIFEQYIISV